MLLAGKPILQIPLVLEQRLTAQATEHLGASETASQAATADELAATLDALTSEARYTAAARRFAAKYGELDPAVQADRMVARVEALIDEGRPARAKIFAG